jgi:hypothetical protein
MKQKCSCGRTWILEMVDSERERKARTVFCECGEILIAAFGNVSYVPHLVPESTAPFDIDPFEIHRVDKTKDLVV